MTNTATANALYRVLRLVYREWLMANGVRPDTTEAMARFDESLINALNTSDKTVITPPVEPDALTRIAVASERTADALEKLASFATADGLAESARIP